MGELPLLFRQRRNSLSAAKKILGGVDGKISLAAKTEYENLLAQIEKIDEEIEGKLENLEEVCMQAFTNPSNKKITDGRRITDPFVENANDTKAQSGISGNDYRQKFFYEVKNHFRTAFNTLRESEMDRGGYLIPSEFHSEIISELKSENILRQICSVVQTENDRKIAIMTNAPSADFVEEGAEIQLSNESFSQKTLTAYKLAAGITITNELLADTHYNIETHLQTEFAKSIASKEEEAFITGSGSTEPYGIATIISDNAATMTVQTAGNNIAADDIISLVYNLKRPYRKNACFLMNDETLATIRKLKNSTQDYLFQSSMQEGEPDRLFGYPVYTSPFIPNIGAGLIPIIFGDFQQFLIAQRGEFCFKALRELYALRDVSVFVLIERVDAVLLDNKAFRGLQIKS